MKKFYDLHKFLVKKGSLITARKLFKGLNSKNKKIILGLDDFSTELENELRKLNVKITYSLRGYNCYAWLSETQN